MVATININIRTSGANRQMSKAANEGVLRNMCAMGMLALKYRNVLGEMHLCDLPVRMKRWTKMRTEETRNLKTKNKIISF